MYIFISVIIVIVLLIISYLPKLNKFRANHADFYNFILTIAATFIGVAIAIDLANIDSERKDKKNALKIIELANLNISQSLNEIIQKEVFIKAKIIDNNNEKLDSISIENYFINNNGLPAPSLFFHALENDLVLKHISRNGLSELYIAKQNLEKQNDALLKSKTSVKNKLLILTVYKKQIGFIYKGLLTEIKYIEGSININEVDDLYQQYGMELVGITK